MGNHRIAFVFFAAFSFLLFHGCSGESDETEVDKLKTVRFGMLPYGDHSYAIIGVKKGWFNEVGINLEYKAIKIEEVVPSLKNKTLDICSTPPGVLIPSYENAPDLRMFVFGDVFQGYAILVKSDSEYKSVADFVNEGLSSEEALQEAAKQLKGKTFTYPSETAIQPFIDLVLNKGGLERADVESLVIDDPLTVNAMRRGQADFQTSGVPSRITLQKEGFRPIISAIDLVKAARPSPESKELSSVFHDGWATSKTYYEEEYATILRLASVNFRITRFMNDNQSEAIALHMPYLTEITGQPFSAEDGKIIYEDLNPFFSFEDQRPWFHDDSEPLYYKHLYGRIIKDFVNQGAFPNNVPTVDDVIFADDIYKELERLSASSEKKIKLLGTKTLSDDDKVTFEKVKHYHSIYNYYDSDRLASDIISDL